jgi:hypothetical protein
MHNKLQDKICTKLIEKYFITSNDILDLPWASDHFGLYPFVLSDISGNTVHGNDLKSLIPPSHFKNEICIRYDLSCNIL